MKENVEEEMKKSERRIIKRSDKLYAIFKAHY